MDTDVCTKLTKKPTGRMTNSSRIAAAMSFHCSTNVNEKGNITFTSKSMSEKDSFKCQCVRWEFEKPLKRKRGDVFFEGRAPQKDLGQNHRTTLAFCWICGARGEDMIYMRRLKLFLQHASEERVREVTGRYSISGVWSRNCAVDWRKRVGRLCVRVRSHAVPGGMRSVVTRDD